MTYENNVNSHNKKKLYGAYIILCVSNTEKVPSVTLALGI